MKRIVVIFSHDRCPADETTRCPMEAYGPFETKEEAMEYAQSLPEAFIPHILFLEGAK